MMGMAGLAACPISTDVQSYNGRCTFDQSVRVLYAIERFLRETEDVDWSNKLLHFFNVSTEQAALLCFNNASFNLRKVGTVTHTSFIGAQGDGGTGYLTYDENMDDLPGVTLNDHGLVVGQVTDTSEAAGVCGALGGGNQIAVRTRNSINFGLWSGFNTVINVATDVGSGVTGFGREDEIDSVTHRSRTSNVATLTVPNHGRSATDAITVAGVDASYNGNVTIASVPDANTITYSNTGSDEATTACGGTINKYGGYRGKGTAISDWAFPADALPTGEFYWLRQGQSGSFSQNQLTHGIVGRISRSEYLAISPALTAMNASLGIQYEGATEPITGPNTFTKAHTLALRDAGLVPIMSNSPPGNDGVDFGTYPFFPGTHFYTRPWSSINSTATYVTASEFLWIDGAGSRTNDVMSPISLNGSGCRTQFTTIDKAIGCTIVKAAWSLGLRMRDDPTYLVSGVPTGVLDIADEYGYDTADWDDYLGGNDNNDSTPDTNLYRDTNIFTGPVGHRAWFNANKATVFTNPGPGGYKTAFDRVVLGLRRQIEDSKMQGHTYDLEASDGRTSAQLLAMHETICDISDAVGRNVRIDSHRLDSGTAALSGWHVDNGYLIIGNPVTQWVAITIDQTTPDLTVAEMIENQLDILRGPAGTVAIDYSKICIKIIVGTNPVLSRARAAAARTWADDHDIVYRMVIRGGADQGGDCTNPFNPVVSDFYGLATCA